ncbi:LCP family protein [Streptomyces sp. NPDC056503]|uniref:LCP family protein n=1 Tax=Streptomyces sp. NPDC056503 TaxID=3345842 RepID=UPI0036A4F5CC
MSQDTRTPEAVGGRRGAATPRKRRRTGRIVLLTLLVLLLAAGGTLYWMYSSIDGNIKAVDIDKALGDDRPEKLPTSGQNLLVLGSDSRAGDNGDLVGGSVGGGRSDTTLVVHIPEGRTKAVAVSIPRDTLVTRPECVRGDGTTAPSAKRVMFNSIYAQYGSACVAKTVESISGVRLDHFMEIDFSGFKDLVDTLGGVTVDVKQPIDDKQSGLHLEAGPQKLDGTQSLAFVRTRHGVGDGSDLGRISLQQQFLTALLTEVKNQDLLSSPAKSYKIADSATKALTTDSALASLTALGDFGRSLNGVDPQNMETIMLPVAYDKIDPNRVVAYEPNASRLWKAVREDAEIPADAKKSPATGG